MPCGDHVRHILEAIDVASLFVFWFPVAIAVKLIQLKRLMQPSNADTAKEADTAVPN